MPDQNQKQLIASIDELRDAVASMDKRLAVIHLQIEPLLKLMQGNGKDGLPTRIAVTERRLSLLERSGSWMMRITLTTILSALGAVIWMLLSR